jgi:hypothetical protein
MVPRIPDILLIKVMVKWFYSEDNRPFRVHQPYSVNFDLC